MKQIFIILLMLPSLCLGRDLEVEKLADNVWQYTSWAEIGSWGRVGSNGLVVVDNGKALLVDTPVDEARTRELLQYIADSLGAKVTTFVAGHWHDDCVGGMAYLNSQGVKTYVNKLTNDILRSKSSPQAKHEFIDSLRLRLGNTLVEFYYPGGGHATDNIAVWLPSERILFGGCLVKDLTSTSLGNTSDAAPRQEWAGSIKKLKQRFANAAIVIPGHGTQAALSYSTTH